MDIGVQGNMKHGQERHIPTFRMDLSAIFWIKLMNPTFLYWNSLWGLRRTLQKQSAGYKTTGLGHRNPELHGSKTNESFPSSLPLPQLPVKVFSFLIVFILRNITSII